MATNRSCVPIRYPTPRDYEIATDAMDSMRPIGAVADQLQLPGDSAHLLSFGDRFAKVDHRCLDKSGVDRKGRIIHVTAMTPTPKGSGKTLTAIALTDGLNRVLTSRGGGQRATFVLRQPSQGPTLGMKGGACGGGYSQVLPMEDINLQFTGDFAAVTQVHNLIWATLMSFINRKGNAAGVDLDSITWPRVVDLCDRSIRSFQVAADGRNGAGLPQFEGHSVITAASEIMASLGISSGLDDLSRRIDRIVLGAYDDGSPLTIRDLEIGAGAVSLLRLAIHPNLVQTLDGSPAFIHTGPFANIAHGNSSRVGLNLARRAADFFVTEGGFAADLGAQKFHDIVLRTNGGRAHAEVVAASLRDLKHQGGATPRGENRTERNRYLYDPDPEALVRGVDNIAVHIENLRAYDLPVVVALNRFGSDFAGEIDLAIRTIEERTGPPLRPIPAMLKGARAPWNWLKPSWLLSMLLTTPESPVDCTRTLHRSLSVSKRLRPRSTDQAPWPGQIEPERSSNPSTGWRN